MGLLWQGEVIGLVGELVFSLFSHFVPLKELVHFALPIDINLRIQIAIESGCFQLNALKGSIILVHLVLIGSPRV